MKTSIVGAVNAVAANQTAHPRPAKALYLVARRRSTRRRGKDMTHSRRDFLARTTCAALSARPSGRDSQVGPGQPLATPPPNTVSTQLPRARVRLPERRLRHQQHGHPGRRRILRHLPGRAADPRDSASKREPAADRRRPSPGRLGRLPPGPPRHAHLNDRQARRRLQRRSPGRPYPTTQSQTRAILPSPMLLFSHSDQIQAWQTGRADIKVGTGWGGRAADSSTQCNDGGGFPTITSIAGCRLLRRPEAAARDRTGNLNSVLALNGF